mgnify:CR=1 FL=1
MAFSVSPSPGGAVPAAPAPDVPPGAGAAPVVPAATTLAEAVELFIARTRHTKTGSAHTEQAYRTDLRHLGAFLTGRRRSYHDVVRRDAALYLSRLATRYAPRTVRRRISTCRSFYRFLRGIEAMKLIDRDQRTPGRTPPPNLAKLHDPDFVITAMTELPAIFESLG